MLRHPLTAAAIWLVLAVAAQAQTTRPSTGSTAQPPGSQSEFPTQSSATVPGQNPDEFAQSQQQATLAADPAYRPRPELQTTAILSGGNPLPVFGTDLFNGAFAGARPSPPSEYEIQPGDKLSVRIYGAINSDAVQTVDTQGRVFVQGVGPVTVGGGPATQAQARIRTALNAVYTDAVSVYVDLLQGGTLGVFVTGDVAQPGRYVGAPGDSVLYFLDQAGGIEATGSFRNVQVLRRGQNVTDYDLYAFLLNGRLEPFRFEDGDTVLVGPRGPLVGVVGQVRNAYAFEVPAGAAQISGRDLLILARPDSAATSAAVISVRKGSQLAGAYNLPQVAAIPFADGDQVEIRSDIYTEQISVTLEGDLRGPSAFALPRGTKLSQLLAQVPVDMTDTATEYVHIERASVAAQQAAALDLALDNLERAVLTQPALTPEAAALKTQEAALVSQFVAQARETVPEGKVAVYTDGRFNDLRLENGDVVIFPRRTDVVIIAGEVLSPGAFVAVKDLSVKDYINRAGGYSPNANKRKFVLRRPDGSALVASGGTRPLAGDQIVVTPTFGNRTLQTLMDLTSIVFEIATTAAVITAINSQ